MIDEWDTQNLIYTSHIDDFSSSQIVSHVLRNYAVAFEYFQILTSPPTASPLIHFYMPIKALKLERKTLSMK